MTHEEFLKKDMELQEQIADLRVQTFQMQSDIAQANKDITKLQFKRTELLAQYSKEPTGISDVL